MDKKLDYIIVGQGLAGSILAYKLLQKGKSVVIIDESKGETSSKKASGLINPITGRRFVKSWKIDELLPFALQFYKSIEETFKTDLIQETKVHRILQSVEQQNDWAAKTKDERYVHYLKNKDVIFHSKTLIENPFGCIEIAPVLKINTPLLIDIFSSYFEKNNLLQRVKFDYKALKIKENKVVYKTFEAEKIIFCEGFGAAKNPWFGNLAYSFCKGEVLWFKAEELPEDFIIGGSTNITPLGNHQFSIGSTYSWDDVSMNITELKKQELIEKLNAIVKCNYTIIKQGAGIRPTIKDRRPIIGAHQTHKNLYIFNGMGTKGLSLAPYFAEEFIEFLEENGSLNSEVKLSRFSKK
ncbi:MAG: NAD(P)/FAD-dependent oxidoreductase [Chitinophagales bacterium]